MKTLLSKNLRLDKESFMSTLFYITITTLITMVYVIFEIIAITVELKQTGFF
ncbi:MAG: hypothetical protein KDC81_00445 [Flavobacteriaceae bacterium]|nr:hypothetical protein [Flavobacteriaceae bacterium]